MERPARVGSRPTTPHHQVSPLAEGGDQTRELGWVHRSVAIEHADDLTSCRLDTSVDRRAIARDRFGDDDRSVRLSDGRSGVG